ncbi:MAG: hypothetical protein AAF566_13155 [Pseudomonadota bacterium]
MFGRVVFLAAAMSTCFFVSAKPVQAHIPHDHVIDLDSTGSTTVAVVRTQYFISRDNGETWQRQTRGIACPWNIEHANRAVAISPAFDQDQTAFLTCLHQVFVSRDGGASYTEVAPAPRGDVVDLFVAPSFAHQGSILALLSDGSVVSSLDAGETWTDIDDLQNITALAWDGNQILAGSAAGEVQVSKDGGATWQGFASTAASSALTGFAFPNGTDLSLPFYAGTDGDGVVEIQLEDAALSARQAGLGDHKITSVTYTGSGDNARLLATTWEGQVFRSDDQGTVWDDVSGGLQTSKQAGEYGQAQFEFVRALPDGTVFIGTFAGLYRSQDAGERWFRMDTTIGHINAVATSPAEGDTYEIAISAYANGIMRSTDFGQTWRFDQSGILVRRLSLEYAPEYAGEQRLFSGSYNRMEFSAGDGSTWRHVSLKNLKELYDTKDPVAPAAIELSPGYAEDGIMILGMFPHGVLRSTDAGRSFEIVMDTDAPSWSLAMSPRFDDDGTVFSNAGGDVYRSTDHGASWTRIWGLDVDRIDLAISSNFDSDQTLFAAGDLGVYRSQNGGESWEEIDLPGENTRAVGLALSPDYASDGLVYVQLAGEDLLVGKDIGAGFSWDAASTPAPGHEFSKLAGQDGFDLFAFSPFFAEDRTMYGGAGRNLLRSEDAGLTWDLLPTLPRRFEAEHGVMDFFHVPVELSGPWRLQRPETRIKTLRWRLGQAWRQVFGGIGTEYGNNSGLGALDSSTAGASLTVDFVGEGVRLLGTKGPDHGFLDIYLNDAFLTSVDLYAPQMEYQVELLADRDLGLASHRLHLEVKGEKNEASSGTRVGIDAVDTFH